MKTNRFGKNLFSCTLTFLILGALSACKCGSKIDKDGMTIKLTYPKGEAVAQVGAVSLTLEELGQDFISRQGTFAGAENLNTEKKRKDFVDSKAMEEAMLQEAIELGYFNKPEVRSTLKKTLVQKLMQDKLEEVQNSYVPTPEEMQKHYNENLNLYKREEALSASYILIPFGDKKEASKSMAEAIYKEAVISVKNGNKKDFNMVAMNYMKSAGAKAPVKVETNQTTFLERAGFDGKFGPGLFDAIKDLPNTGDLAPLLTGANGYLIAMKNGYRKALDETMAQAEDKIKRRLAYQNRGKAYEEYQASLRKKYDIKIFEDKVPELGKAALAAIKKKENVAANAPQNEPEEP